MSGTQASQRHRRSEEGCGSEQLTKKEGEGVTEKETEGEQGDRETHKTNTRHASNKFRAGSPNEVAMAHTDALTHTYAWGH